VTSDQLPRSAGHTFYKVLNSLLSEANFDRWIEERCERYYGHNKPWGHRSLRRGIYFRMLSVGYFEGISSQRGIAWRCADSLSLREFLGIGLSESRPDYSTLLLIRRRLPAEVFDEVFQFVLKIAADKKLLSGKTVGVDSSTLEAYAARKSIGPITSTQMSISNRYQFTSSMENHSLMCGAQAGRLKKLLMEINSGARLAFLKSQLEQSTSLKLWRRKRRKNWLPTRPDQFVQAHAPFAPSEMAGCFRLNVDLLP
jgi:hypothetical protein